MNMSNRPVQGHVEISVRPHPLEHAVSGGQRDAFQAHA